MTASLLFLAPAAALGQNATWRVDPPTTTFGDGANWSTGTVPTGTASFGASNRTNISISADQTIDAFAFNAVASPYQFGLAANLTFNGTGIGNNPPHTQPPVFTPSAGGATMTFDNSASAGAAFIGHNATTTLFRNSSTASFATLNGTGTVTFSDTSRAANANINLSNGSTLTFANASSARNANITITGSTSTATFLNGGSADSAIITATSGALLRFMDNASAKWARVIANSGASVDMSAMTSALSIGSIEGNGGFVLGGGEVSVGVLDLSTIVGGVISGGGGTALAKVGTGMLFLEGANTYAGGTAINGGTISVASDGNLGAASGALSLNGGTLRTTQSFTSNRAVTLNTNGGTLTPTTGTTLTLGGTIGGTGRLTMGGPGTLVLIGANTYSGGTTVTGGLINFTAGNNLGTGTITLNGGGLQWAANNLTDISGRLAPLGAGGATFDTNNNNVTFTAALSGPGGLTKAGLGTLTLSGANTYSGGTTVTGGTLQLAPGASLGSSDSLTINGGTFAINGNVSVGSLSGTGGTINLVSGILTTNSASNTILASTIMGAGGLTKLGTGTLFLTGNNTYAGPTVVSGGVLAVSGSITSNVTVNTGGTLGGIGTIAGNVVTQGTLAPGNSIGTLSINGNYTQSAGSTYQVEVSAAGQSDKLNVSGTATIAGGTVAVQAQSGNYARSTTYTILTAGGGLSGTYSNVTSNFAFLTPTLAYDANNVYLSLFLNQGAFAAGARTSNQYAVGTALDQANIRTATGDFNMVLNALAVLSTAQGPWALNQLSGQPYADFGTTNVANASLFMNTLGQQMALARSGSAAGSRIALAQACEVEACDEARPLSAWFSGLGGLGSVQGDGNASTLTYNVGGAAAGIDYRFDPRFLIGLGAGYTHGTQWANSFMGQGWTDSVSVAAYGSFTQAGFYADALVGYAYLNNQMQRQILIPGLQQRTANGSTGANQFLAQVETGYKLGVWDMASVTPFARFQTSSTTQNAFIESGANSLNLNVAQRTTTSVRTVLGAEFASSIPLRTERTLGLSLRLGWQHEYAYIGRPITASFAGAPSASFTVYGATPQRDSAIIGFSAMTNVATSTQLYLRYDGELASGTDNHALTAGLRMSW